MAFGSINATKRVFCGSYLAVCSELLNGIHGQCEIQLNTTTCLASQQQIGACVTSMSLQDFSPLYVCSSYDHSERIWELLNAVIVPHVPALLGPLNSSSSTLAPTSLCSPRQVHTQSPRR